MTQLEPKSILIVEDEEILLQALHEKLSHKGYTILTASNGKEGLEVATTKHPDLILLDIVMPVMDGISMLKMLRSDTWGKTVPVLMLTNLVESHKRDESNAHDVSDYLIKSDWSLEDLVKKIQETLTT